MTSHGMFRPGWIYYALGASAREQLVKVGFATDVRRRMNALRRHSPAPGRQIPTVLAVELGTLADEADRHTRWAGLRVHGEWFRYEGDLRRYIAGLPDRVEDAFTRQKPEISLGDSLELRTVAQTADCVARWNSEITAALAIRDEAITDLLRTKGPAEVARLCGVSLSTVKLARGRS